MIRYNIFAFYILLILMVSGLLYLYSRSYFDETSNTAFVVAENRTVLNSVRLSILTSSGGTVRASGSKMLFYIDNGTFSLLQNVSIVWDSSLSVAGGASPQPPSTQPPYIYLLTTDSLDYREDKVFYLPNGGNIAIRSRGNDTGTPPAPPNTDAPNAVLPMPSSSGDLDISVKPGVLVFDPTSNAITSDNAVLHIVSDNFTLHSIGTASIMYDLASGGMMIDGISEILETATGNTLVSDKIMFNSHKSTIEFLGNVSIKVQERGNL